MSIALVSWCQGTAICWSDARSLMKDFAANFWHLEAIIPLGGQLVADFHHLWQGSVPIPHEERGFIAYLMISSRKKYACKYNHIKRIPSSSKQLPCALIIWQCEIQSALKILDAERAKHLSQSCSPLQTHNRCRHPSWRHVLWATWWHPSSSSSWKAF